MQGSIRADPMLSVLKQLRTDAGVLRRAHALLRAPRIGS